MKSSAKLNAITYCVYETLEHETMTFVWSNFISNEKGVKVCFPDWNAHFSQYSVCWIKYP